jgi:hypothetical protein
MAVKTMPSFNVDSLLAEDKELEGLELPFRFGYPFDVNYGLEDGKWIDDADRSIWSLRFHSKGAYSINFLFSEMTLSPEAELYVFSSDGSMVYGPVTAKQNITNGQYGTGLLKGDDVVIQLIEPASAKGQSQLAISRVVHGYRNTFSSPENPTSLSCHNNVCDYPAWSDQSNAVANVIINGTAQCSGSLLNNTNQDDAPYFLTAFHCLDLDKPHGTLSPAEKAYLANTTFEFNYKTCGTSVYYSQAEFRAGWSDTDFLLVRLSSSISSGPIRLLGWDKSGNVSSTGTGIHHPQGDSMKISFDNNSVPICTNNYWEVGYSSGTTEGGSSGSPLFNTDKRVIGQLYGGESGCPPVSKFYGRFDKSWTGGGTADTRLKDWLDPFNKNPQTLDTKQAGSGFKLVGNIQQSACSGKPAINTSLNVGGNNYVNPGGCEITVKMTSNANNLTCTVNFPQYPFSFYKSGSVWYLVFSINTATPPPWVFYISDGSGSTPAALAFLQNSI